MTAPAHPGGETGGFVDLHMHSTASDGAFAPEAVVEEARARGLSAIALTDHDTLAGVSAARAAGERLGVRVVPGVELSAFDDGREVHLLGLHVAEVDALQERLAELRESRVARAEAIVRKVNALGMPLSIDAVLGEAQGGAVGRPHVAKAMVAGGWVKDAREAFDRYLGNGRPANVDKQRLSIQAAIRLVHDAGGIAAVAHPGPEGRRDTVRRLLAHGLDGLEVRHPGHSPDDVTRIGALVTEFDLVPTGGSDWHGAMEGPRVMGAMQVPGSWLQRQEARVAARRGEARTP